MPRGLPRVVKDHLEKAMDSSVAAVGAYNRPGRRFRTAEYIVLMSIAWTALFHAVFYLRNEKPWYRKRGSGEGTAVRYVRVDGEPKHWELAECLSKFFGSTNPPERQNLEFLIGLRNKIEHRHLPELDPSLYGECQAALLNFEDFLVANFGPKYALTEQLAVSLQFSRVIPAEKRRAAKVLASHEAASVRDYVERFRGNLPSTVLSSMKYSFNVFLVPKVANRQKMADAAVEFVRVDESSPEELGRLEKLNVLIREKRIPIANLDLYRPGEVVDQVSKALGGRFNMTSHTDAWHRHAARPAYGASKPEETKSEYCVYDSAHGDYLYTNAWVQMLIREVGRSKYQTKSSCT